MDYQAIIAVAQPGAFGGTRPAVARARVRGVHAAGAVLLPPPLEKVERRTPTELGQIAALPYASLPGRFAAPLAKEARFQKWRENGKGSR